MEPFYGGSHKAFLDGWIKHSNHRWNLLTLPDIKWKWRMRHSAITFAEQANHLWEKGQRWDLIFCSDMLNLAEFYGLTNNHIQKIPSVIYFHENQLTYPVRKNEERDYHFAMINFTSCLKADQIWFNSNFHRNSFLTALKIFLERMPDNKHLDRIKEIEDKSIICSPGIEKIKLKKKKQTKPVHIIWAARWEHDKNPEDFFTALKTIKGKGIQFKLSVIGQQYSNSPSIFSEAKTYFKNEIVNWGYQNSYSEYITALSEADILVSTANHEFFGISVIEAVAQEVFPILPNRLSYPELFPYDKFEECYYNNSIKDLINKLLQVIDLHSVGRISLDPGKFSEQISPFFWIQQTPIFDKLLSSQQ